MRSFSVFLSTLIVVIIVFLTAAAFAGNMHFAGSSEEGLLDFSDNWTYSDGSPADLEKLAKESNIDLYHDIEQGSDDVDLCFQSKNIDFSIYVGDELIYDFHPEIFPLFGFSYGKYVHSVRLPDITGTSTIRIEAQPAYDSSVYFREVYLDKSSDYYIFIFRRYFGAFIVCALVAALGVILFAAGIIYTVKVEERIQTISLGLLAVLSGVWEGTETLVPQMLTGNSAGFHFINYVSLMFTVIPSIYLISNLTGFPDSKLIKTVDILAVVNMIVQIVCTLTGIADYHQLLTMTHAVIVITVIMAIVLIVRAAVSKRINRKKFITAVIAFLALAVSGMIDIVLYVLGNSYGFIFMIGILLFVIFLGFYEIQELLEISEQTMHAREMHRLAHTDGLTGLENRLSFGEYEQYISEKSDGSYLIVQFDVNNLKTVNDKYGHSEGDRHIKAAADTIRICFEGQGHIFRTGGDEFIAILRNDDGKARYNAAMKEFGELIQAYNETEMPPVALSIACGSAEYNCGAGETIGDAEVLADNLMYENKKMLKAAMHGA